MKGGVPPFMKEEMMDVGKKPSKPMDKRAAGKCPPKRGGRSSKR